MRMRILYILECELYYVFLNANEDIMEYLPSIPVFIPANPRPEFCSLGCSLQQLQLFPISPNPRPKAGLPSCSSGRVHLEKETRGQFRLSARSIQIRNYTARGEIFHVRGRLGELGKNPQPHVGIYCRDNSSVSGGKLRAIVSGPIRTGTMQVQ